MPTGQKELESDVVVIGGGACGLAAALTVGFGKKSVTVLEKSSEFGGMTNWCEGMFAVGSRYQRQMKLPYTVEDRFKEHMEATYWSADPRIVRAFMEKTADTIDWLEDMGCEFAGVVAHYPGAPFVWHVFKHTPGVTIAPGRELIEKMLNKANEQKRYISLLPETRCTSILREGGMITGVTAEDKDGNPVRIKSSAVVCATGGYGDNREWVERYCKAGYSIKSWDDQHQTGDAIKMAWDVGAAPDGLGVMQAFTFTHGEMVNTQLFAAGLQASLWVNERGERFTDESNIWRFPVITNAISRQPNARAYNIFDQDMVTFLKEKGILISLGEYLQAGSRLTDIEVELERGIREGKVFASSTIEELARMLNIDPGTLSASVREYNACCDSNFDSVMSKERQYLHAIKKPLFFAIKLSVVIGITEGGIKINHKMEVIDNDFNVIPGLYAGGCAAGGMVGDVYIIVTSGASDSFAVNSGRIAGESILKYLKTKEVSNMSQSGHFDAGGPPEEFWKGIQQHMGYSDEELEHIKKSKFAKVLSVMPSPAVQGKTMVVEVVRSHGCAEGMKPGDKLYFTGCSNLDPTRSSRWCAYNMSHICNFANLCHNMLLQGIDPNEMYSNHFSCMDCGSELGLGLVVSKVTVIDEPKK